MGKQQEQEWKLVSQNEKSRNISLHFPRFQHCKFWIYNFSDCVFHVSCLFLLWPLDGVNCEFSLSCNSYFSFIFAFLKCFYLWLFKIDIFWTNHSTEKKFLKGQVLRKEEGNSTGTQIPLISLHSMAKKPKGTISVFQPKCWKIDLTF